MSLPTARKWRPQTFDEVVGQDEVVKALKSAISTGRIGHAYLFSGPRGVGKTTLSRILAKSLNCLYGPTTTPCNKCENCIEIKEGTSVDVIEIDGASNRKIDDVRTIREAVKFVPVKSKYKIYIIDEVHMLTDEAFNALLKTLEEPPQHVVFIFATTEPYKVKQTIRSRCQHFVLKPLSIDNIFKQLKKIAKSEGYKLTDTILTKIAKAGNGSMRDAESIFDMVVSYIGEDIFNEEKVKNINEEDISKLLGIIDISDIEKILSTISSKNSLELIRIVNNLNQKGFEMKKLTEELIKTFRNLLILKEFGVDKNLLKILDEEIQILEKFKEKFTKEELLFIENTLIETYSELRFTINELFHIENAIFKIANPDNIITISKILEEVKDLKSKLITISTNIPSNLIKNETSTQEEKTKKKVLDPVENLIEEIESSKQLSENELKEIIKDIISKYTINGLEKKVNIQIQHTKIILEVPEGFKKELQEKSEKIKSDLKRITSSDFEIEINEIIIQNQSKNLQKQTTLKPQSKSDEIIRNLFNNAEKIESFLEKK